MTVNFESSLTEDKEIQAWNIFTNNFVSRIGSAHLGLGTSMQITRTGHLGTSCLTGTDTVILCRYYAWPRGRTALYTFPPQDFWDFWGGCTVTFKWLLDTRGSGLWGNQTPQPMYPVVKAPDGTLLGDSLGGLSIVFGGAAFAVKDQAYIAAMDLDINKTQEGGADAIPFPADGTLLREISQPKVFVVYGGTGFWIPDPATLHTLGFDFSKMRVIPDGSMSKLGAMPIERTLLKEQHSAKVYVVQSQTLRWVTSPSAMDRNCLAWRHVRTVPDGALSALPRGTDLF
jgi:hypothetical protein